MFELWVNNELIGVYDSKENATMDAFEIMLNTDLDGQFEIITKLETKAA